MSSSARLQRTAIAFNITPRPGAAAITCPSACFHHPDSRRRNEELARIFHDLKLMEREGSGIGLLFERLLASGRKVPTIGEGTNSVHVTVPRRVVQPGIIKLLVGADQRYQLTQRERITFALVAQAESLLRAPLRFCGTRGLMHAPR